MSQNAQPFQPDPASGVALNMVAANATQAIAVTKGCKQIRIVVTAPATGVNFRISPVGDNTAASANDMLILPGMPPQVITKDADCVQIQAICVAGGAAGQVISGNGNGNG